MESPRKCRATGAPIWSARRCRISSRSGEKAYVCHQHITPSPTVGPRPRSSQPSGSSGPQGSLDTDLATRALLQYLNTPLHDFHISPAQMLCGRQLRDSVPTLRRHHLISREWGNYLRHRERHITRNMERMEARHERTAHTLTPISVGQHVRVQNPTSGQWDRTGTIKDTERPRQYIVRMDGSG